MAHQKIHIFVFGNKKLQPISSVDQGYDTGNCSFPYFQIDWLLGFNVRVPIFPLYSGDPFFHKLYWGLSGTNHLLFALILQLFACCTQKGHIWHLKDIAVKSIADVSERTLQYTSVKDVYDKKLLSQKDINMICKNNEKRRYWDVYR